MVKSGLVLACVALAQWVSAQQAPQMEALPIDPNVRYGVLDNGLTYYVRHNETPKNRTERVDRSLPNFDFEWGHWIYDTRFHRIRYRH